MPVPPPMRLVPFLAALLATGGCLHGQRIESLGDEISAIRVEDARRDEELAAVTRRLEAAEAELEAERARIEALESERDELAEALEGTRARAERLQSRVARLERAPRASSTGEVQVTALLPDDLPADPALHAAIAREHLERGESAVARAILTHALELVGDTEPAAELRYLAGMTWFHEERWGQAATVFQVVTEAHADTEWAAWSLVRQGECFREMGDVATARVFLEELVERFPDTDAAADAERLLSDLPPTAL